MNVARWGLPLAGLLLLIAGVPMTIAGLFAQQAQNHVDHWHGVASHPTSQEWLIAQAAARQAVRWYPVASGDYLDRQGRVQSWAPVGHNAEGEQSDRLLARNLYRASLAVRPHWPYSWVGLAESKIRLHQFDEELELALGKAADLGPWRIGINRSLMQLGFKVWKQMTPLQRSRTLESASRAVAFGSREAQGVVSSARQAGLLEVLCRSLQAQPIKIPAACARPRYTKGESPPSR